METDNRDFRDILVGLRKPLYVYDLAILKQYGDTAFKLTRSRCVRNKGVESPEKLYVPKGSVNEEKLDNNIARSRSKVREYGLCSPWQFFCTFTIDPQKFDRYDLQKYHDAMSQWVRNYNKRRGASIRYLIIPEQHKDGAWHEHGLLMGIPLDHLRLFTLDEKLPNYIRDKLEAGQLVYDWPAYREKFGWVIIEPIRDLQRAVSYITKYITKDLARSISELGAHLYYCSKGLATASELKRGTMAATIVPDFENDFCKLNWFDAARYSAEQLAALIT